MQATPNSSPSVNTVLTSETATSIDSQGSQFYSGVVALRQGRVNQLQREAAALTAEYGAKDPGVIAVNSSLAQEQSAVKTLSVAKLVGAKTIPVAPKEGWVLYGHVLSATLAPVPKQTLILVSESKEWQREYGYAFSDSDGYFTLSYAPDPEATGANLSLSIQVLDENKAIVFDDATATTLKPNQVIYRDVVLPGGTVGVAPKGVEIPTRKS